MKITEHLNKKQSAYALYDNYRSIGNYIDGFKPSSRKIFHTINDFKKFTKIDTIANTTALKTKYKHGSVSLEGVAAGMGQTFTGTNIISVFKTKGYFGTRTSPYPGASRYIEAMKNPLIDYIFRPEDYNILDFQNDENISIEPKFYIPIIPTILLGNLSGIGNGYSQNIYSRNIKEIITFIKNSLSSQTFMLPDLLPYFEGFKGKITKGNNPNQYNIYGILNIINTTTIEISEIPINVKVDKYISFLNTLEDNKIIKDFKNKSHKNSILFEIKVPRELTKEPLEKLYKTFNLDSTITETLTVNDENNSIFVFNNIYEIFQKFYNIRLEYYQKRKDYIVEQLKQEILILKNKRNFIQGFNNGFIELTNKTKNEIEFKLYDSYYDKIDDSYDYLLDMKIYNLTLEKLDEIIKKVKEKELVLEKYLRKDIKEIWLEELVELEEVLGLTKKKSKKEKTIITSTPTSKLDINTLF